jgi:hypothetical protein
MISRYIEIDVTNCEKGETSEAGSDDLLEGALQNLLLQI